MKVRAHVFVAGRVQGVFFRSETRAKAKKRGVTGWVKNLPDGRVEAVFEGEETSVKELVEFCRKGPSDAGIRSFSVSLETWTGEFKDFEIRSSWGF